MVFRVKEHIRKIRSRCVEAGLSERVAFTAGFDGTVLAKSFQIHYSSDGNTVVGGVYPNHMLPLPEGNSDDTDGEAVANFLGECVNGKKGEAASEIKVCVLSFQCTPPGTTPYYTLVGRPQTINEQSTFGCEVVKACVRATIEDGNAILLNTTTDGVSTEVQWNKEVMLDYIDGKHNYVSLPDTNHNVKNSRYQLIGGSSPASIGAYVFDPALLRLARVNQKLWRVEDFASDAVVLKLASVDTIQKLHNLALQDRMNCDVGNHAVTVISLLFMRLRAYAVNSRMVPWRDRAIYSWVTLVWFTSFHTSGSTMMANKRNMLLETVGILFLIARDDVFHTRRNTSECNEHTFGMWRTMSSSREFNMDQLIRIVQKTNIRTDAIFSSQLKTRRSKHNLAGYQATFEEYVQSVNNDNPNDKQCHGKVHVSLDKSAVSSLWDEVRGVIEYSNDIATSFLSLFGIEDGNGLSTCASSIDEPSDLSGLISKFFMTPTQDNRGRGAVTTGSTANINVNNETPDEVDDNNDDNGVNNYGEDRDNNAAMDTGTAGLSPEMIATHVSFINECTSESVTDHVTNNVNDSIRDEDRDGSAVSPDANDGPIQGMTSSNCIEKFMELMNCNKLDAVSSLALNLIQLLELGKMSSGSIDSQSKYMSRNQRWFKAKERGGGSSATGEGKDGNVIRNEPEQKFVTRNSLIELRCVRGPKNNSTTTVEYYRVLSFFTKTYNKWYMAVEDKFVYTPSDPKKMASIRFLAQLMEKKGATYKEVQLTKEGQQWGPTHVYCIRTLNDIVSLTMDNQGTVVVLDLYGC